VITQNQGYYYLDLPSVPFFGHVVPHLGAGMQEAIYFTASQLICSHSEVLTCETATAPIAEVSIKPN
jgi:hypothetical protein